MSEPEKKPDKLDESKVESQSLEERLQRLEDLGQIRRNSAGNYHLSGRSLVSAAVIFQKTRSLVMGRKLRSSRQNDKADR